MSYVGWSVLTLVILLMIKCYVQCFKAIEFYIMNKGFQNNTVCYIKQPFSSSVHTKITNQFVSKIIIKSLLMIILVMSIAVALILQQPWLGIAIVLSDYLLLRIWFRIYSEASGVKLLEHGVAKGVHIIPWNSIKKYQIKPSQINRHAQGNLLQLYIEKRLIPIYIEITNQNQTLLEKYLRDNCII